MSLGWAFMLAYAVVGWLLQDRPLALSIFGNASLIGAASAVVVVILRRRRDWKGSDRLFWDVVGVAMALWIVGHVGWAYDQIVHHQQYWLKWHTIFSICAGIGPLIALSLGPTAGHAQDSSPRRR